MTTTTARTLFDRVWDAHVIAQEPGAPAVLYVDLQLVHEVTSPQAFAGLRARGLRVRRPDRTVATMDHSTPTLPAHLAMVDEMGRAQLGVLEKNCREFGIGLHALGSPTQGIVHVIGPELGLTQPGMTIVCGDSHTSTHGAFGALAFGIGTSEVEHVLATQCLLQHKPQTMCVRVDGALRRGVGAKDVILALIAQIGIGGATGHVIEYTGEAIRALDMEARMTDLQHVDRGGRPRRHDRARRHYLPRTSPRASTCPKGEGWDAALARWRRLATDEGAIFDRT